MKCSANVWWSMPLVASCSKSMPEFISKLIELSFHLSCLQNKLRLRWLLQIELKVELPGAFGLREVALEVAEGES